MLELFSVKIKDSFSLVNFHEEMITSSSVNLYIPARSVKFFAVNGLENTVVYYLTSTEAQSIAQDFRVEYVSPASGLTSTTSTTSTSTTTSTTTAGPILTSRNKFVIQDGQAQLDITVNYDNIIANRQVTIELQDGTRATYNLYDIAGTTSTTSTSTSTTSTSTTSTTTSTTSTTTSSTSTTTSTTTINTTSTSTSTTSTTTSTTSTTTSTTTMAGSTTTSTTSTSTTSTTTSTTSTTTSTTSTTTSTTTRSPIDFDINSDCNSPPGRILISNRSGASLYRTYDPETSFAAAQASTTVSATSGPATLIVFDTLADDTYYVKVADDSDPSFFTVKSVIVFCPGPGITSTTTSTTSTTSTTTSTSTSTSTTTAAPYIVSTSFVQDVDIPYGALPRQKVDIYTPNGTIDGVVVYIHGGGWSGGDKTTDSSLCSAVCLAGYVVVAVNYRLVNASNGEYPNNILDIATVIRNLTVPGAGASESPKWAILRSYLPAVKLIISGGSAGGHLSMAGTIENGVTNGTWPDVVINYAGPTDLEFMDDFNDEILPDAYSIIINEYTANFTERQLASPRHRYGNIAIPGPDRTTINSSPTQWWFVANNNDNLVPTECMVRFAYALPSNKRRIFNLDQSPWLINTSIAPPNSTRTAVDHYYISTLEEVLRHQLQNICPNRNRFYPITNTYSQFVTYSISATTIEVNAGGTVTFEVRMVATNASVPSFNTVYWRVAPTSTVTSANLTGYPTTPSAFGVSVYNWTMGTFTVTISSSFTGYGILILDLYKDIGATTFAGRSYRVYVNPTARVIPSLVPGLCRTIYNGSSTANFITFTSTATVINRSIDTKKLTTSYFTSNVENIYNTDNFTVEWKGFFVPTVTGNYTFNSKNVDDALFIWVGQYEAANPTKDNALIKDETLFVDQAGVSIYLHANYRHPIRIIYVQVTGPLSANIVYSGPGIGETDDFTNRIFHTTCSSVFHNYWVNSHVQAPGQTAIFTFETNDLLGGTYYYEANVWASNYWSGVSPLASDFTDNSLSGTFTTTTTDANGSSIGTFTKTFSNSCLAGKIYAFDIRRNNASGPRVIISGLFDHTITCHKKESVWADVNVGVVSATPRKIAILGDSITEAGGGFRLKDNYLRVDRGLDASNTANYTVSGRFGDFMKMIKGIFPNDIIYNLSRGGMTTHEAVTGFPREGTTYNPFGTVGTPTAAGTTALQWITNNQPDYVIIRYGVADIILRNNVVEAINYYISLLDHIYANGGKAIVIGPTYVAISGSDPLFGPADPSWYNLNNNNFNTNLIAYNDLLRVGRILWGYMFVDVMTLVPRASYTPGCLLDGFHLNDVFGGRIVSAIGANIAEQFALTEGQSFVFTATSGSIAPSSKIKLSLSGVQQGDFVGGPSLIDYFDVGWKRMNGTLTYDTPYYGNYLEPGFDTLQFGLRIPVATPNFGLQYVGSVIRGVRISVADEIYWNPHAYIGQKLTEIVTALKAQGYDVGIIITPYALDIPGVTDTVLLNEVSSSGVDWVGVDPYYLNDDVNWPISRLRTWTLNFIGSVLGLGKKVLLATQGWTFTGKEAITRAWVLEQRSYTGVEEFVQTDFYDFLDIAPNPTLLRLDNIDFANNYLIQSTSPRTLVTTDGADTPETMTYQLTGEIYTWKGTSAPFVLYPRVQKTYTVNIYSSGPYDPYIIPNTNMATMGRHNMKVGESITINFKAGPPSARVDIVSTFDANGWGGTSPWSPNPFSSFINLDTNGEFYFGAIPLSIPGVYTYDCTFSNFTAAMIGGNLRRYQVTVAPSGPSIAMASLQNTVDTDYKVLPAATAPNIFLYVDKDGYLYTRNQAGTTNSFGNWATPQSANVGINYYVKYTAALNTKTTGGSYYSPTSGWNSLAATVVFGVTAQANVVNEISVTYTVQISSTASDTGILATGTITLIAYVDL